MHLCCDWLFDVRLVLNEKIKLVSNGVVLSPILFMTEQYAIRVKNIGWMKYTANDGCFHDTLKQGEIQTAFWLRN